MNRLLFTAAAALSLSLASSPAIAASNGAYAKWTMKPSSSTARVHTGTIKFGVAGIPDATFTVVKKKTDTEPVDLLTSSSGGDWLTGTTPFGAVFGSSQPTSAKYIEVAEETLGGSNHTVTTITFKSPMPANTLGFAVGDLDVDKIVVRAKGASGSYLRGAQLAGSARHITFNFCAVKRAKPSNCDSDTAVPRWLPGRTGGTVLGNGDSSNGASAWLRPNQPVKSITLTFSAFSGISSHSFRLWMAVPRTPHFTG